MERATRRSNHEILVTMLSQRLFDRQLLGVNRPIPLTFVTTCFRIQLTNHHFHPIGSGGGDADIHGFAIVCPGRRLRGRVSITLEILSGVEMGKFLASRCVFHVCRFPDFDTLSCGPDASLKSTRKLRFVTSP